MSKPKIAVLMDWYLPGTKAGGPVRSVYALVHLLKDHFDFYIITLNRDLGSSTPYPDLTPDTLLQKNGVHYVYCSPQLLQENGLLRLLETLSPELIYLNSFWSWHFSIRVVRMKHKGLLRAAVLLAPRGMLGKGALGLKALKKRLFLGLGRLLNWYAGLSFHATQEQERSDILAKFPRARVFTAPNINVSPVLANTSKKERGHLKLFFLSRIAEVKNLHFALEVLKQVPSTCTIDYEVYGNIEDQAYWAHCEQLIAALPAHITVVYGREIPFDRVQETIGRSHALLMPTLNENYGHSIVESLLSGCPVIISDQTPWTDLEPANAGFALPLNSPEKFLAAIVALAELDQEGFTEKSKCANRYISQKINPTQAKNLYIQLFHDAIKNRPVQL